MPDILIYSNKAESSLQYLRPREMRVRIWNMTYIDKCLEDINRETKENYNKSTGYVWNVCAFRNRQGGPAKT